MTGENLLRSLELRLDNVVYRSGFAPSRAAARQLVNHGHFAVNGARRTSRRTSSSRATSWRSASRAASASRSRSPRRPSQSHQAPEWLTIDAAKLAGSVVAPPRRDQMPLDLNEQLVVEYYSR